MSLRGTWYAIKQNVPKPEWVKSPNLQRFCCCCSIRTGASLIGWFNFIINSVYIGMLLLTMTDIRNVAYQEEKAHRALMSQIGEKSSDDGAFNETETVQLPLLNGTDPTVVIAADDSYKRMKEAFNETETVQLPLPNGTDPTVVIAADDSYKRMKEVIDFTLPIMYKSICIPAIIIIFSILWLITVESRKLLYVRLFGKAFMISICIQLIAQLAFMIYVEIEVRETFHTHTSVITWIVFTVYALLNMYFIPILSEFIRRRIRECTQGMEQGLLTSEMYPRARVAEEYIQDAFTVEPDTDMVQFEASLVTTHKESSQSYQRGKSAEEDCINDGPI